MIMTSWPWMKGEPEAPSATTDDSAGADDHRPAVKALLSEYRDLIDQVQNELGTNELYDPTKHDDLWICRFLVSHKKNVERSLQAINNTLLFRQKYSLDEKDLRALPLQAYYQLNSDNEKNESDENQGISNIPNQPAFQRFMDGVVGKDAILFVVPGNDENAGTNITTPTRPGVIGYLKIASIDTHKLATVEQDDWVVGMCFVNEWSHQWLDYKTRVSGRLTKAVRIVDVSGLQFSMFNNTTRDLYATATRVLEDCYPQALQIILVCNAPRWVQMPWRLLRPLLPVRVVEKIDFVDPNDENDRQRLLQYVDEIHLPERLGGKYKE